MKLPEWVWLNGQFIRSAQACVSPFDRGLALGDGLYETLRGFRGRPLFFGDHWARLSRSAAALGLTLPTEAESLSHALTELISRNALGQTAVRLRVVLTRGVSIEPPWEMRCVEPTLLATAWPAPPPRERPLALATIAHRRDGSDPIWQHKTLNTLSAALARAELIRRGFDDGLILNTADRACEATTSNIFALMDGRVVTPPASEGLLTGTVRGRLLRGLGEAGDVSVAEEPLPVAALAGAEAVWLTNAITPVAEVGSLDGKAIRISEAGTRVLRVAREAVSDAI